MATPSQTNDTHSTATSTFTANKETNYQKQQQTPCDTQQSNRQNPLSSPSASTTAATPVQIALAAILLGTSAGLTLYTKKTSSMLQRMERMNKNAVQRKGPEKFGPKTKSEWEKMRNRWGKDDDDIV